ncbi:hypothetical protein [Ilumatobacter sp.]|uniref:hypothetical protein n=1 Tax=Ilumatobacter sp. TaxID=1967498 RepID=UPI003AF58A0C
MPTSPTSASTVDFASAARTLTREARRRGLVGPSFRCPPRLVGVDRSIRRRADGAIVSVRLRGRPWVAVLADMIEGVIVSNGLTAPQSDRLRGELWELCGAERFDDRGHDHVTRVA